MKTYEPRDWYWAVAGSATEVYSSKSGGFVPVDDDTYRQWLAGGGAPTRIVSEAELGEVLAQYSLRPVAPGVLDGFAETQAAKLPMEVVLKVLLNHENRIRQLESRPSVSPAQFKTFLKGLV
jgi:hypothetical protein